MGAPVELNYILKLKPEQGLDEAALVVGHTAAFVKAGHRIYPVDVPIDLANSAWDVIARVVVREFTVGGGRTSGRYEVLRVYTPAERAVLTDVTAVKC